MVRSHRHRLRDDRGVALVAALAIVFILLMLSTAAASQVVSSTNQAAVAGRQVQSVDAGEAGVQTLIASVVSAFNAGATTFACPSAATAVGAETYTLSSATVAGTATPTTALIACTGTLTLLATATTGQTYLIAVKGTPSTGTGSTTTEEVQIYDPPLGNYAASANFPDSMFAAYTAKDNGGVTISGSSQSSLSGGVYAGLGGACGTASSYSGNYYDFSFNPATAGTYPDQSYDSPSTPATTYTGCKIGGDLDDNGAISMSGGSVGGSIYSGDATLTLSNSATVGGSIYNTGPVSLSSATVGTSGTGLVLGGALTANSSTVNGTIFTGQTNSYPSSSGAETQYAGNDVITGGRVNGSIYATGNVQILGGAVVTGTVYAGGSITVSGSGSKVGGQAQIPGLTVQLTNLECVVNYRYTGYTGDGSCSDSAPFAQVESDPSLATLNTYYPQYLPDGQTALAGSTALGNGVALTGSVFPALNYDANAWLLNTSFCPPPTGYNRCVGVTATNSTSCNIRNASTPPNAICLDNITDCADGQLAATINNMNTTNVLPTVITTTCELNWLGQMPLQSNLAVFDSSGFAFNQNTAVYSNDGKGDRFQFYAIVPSSAATYSTAAAGTTQAPTVTHAATTPPTTMDTCTSNSITDGPDIIVGGSLTDTSASTPDLVQDFLYTPQSICRNSGSTTVTTSGKLYAGYRIDLTGGTGTMTDAFTTYSGNTNPWTGTVGQAAPSVTFIRKLSGT